MAIRQLEGEVVDPNMELRELRDDVSRLEDDVARLEGDLRKMRSERDKALGDNIAAMNAIRSLRDALGPLWRSLRAVFGEIEIVAGEYDHQPQATTSTANGGHAVDSRLHAMDKWEGVKKRLGGKEAELIDVLLTSGPRTNTQLKSLLRAAYSTVCALTLKMSNMGFITREGEAYKLKD